MELKLHQSDLEMKDDFLKVRLGEELLRNANLMLAEVRLPRLPAQVLRPP